jgi:hypothetical protein
MVPDEISTNHDDNLSFCDVDDGESMFGDGDEAASFGNRTTGTLKVVREDIQVRAYLIYVLATYTNAILCAYACACVRADL